MLRAYRINALHDAHHDNLTFGYRYLADEARRAGWRMSRRTAWKLCSYDVAKMLTVAFGGMGGYAVIGQTMLSARSRGRAPASRRSAPVSSRFCSWSCSIEQLASGTKHEECARPEACGVGRGHASIGVG